MKLFHSHNLFKNCSTKCVSVMDYQELMALNPEHRKGERSTQVIQLIITRAKKLF